MNINHTWNLKRINTWTVLTVVFLIVYSCSNRIASKGATNHAPESYSIEVPSFPDYTNIPIDNPMTKEGVELGRYLFYDGRLSGNTRKDLLMSCATCHKQINSFECGLDNPRFKDGHPCGITGKPTPHSMLPFINLAWNTDGYFWNGMIVDSNSRLGSIPYGIPAEEPYNFRNIESVVWMAIAAPHEMNGKIERSVKTIQNIPMYPPMFAKAFGSDTINLDRISKAIAQFIRSLVSSNSRFDQYMDGKVKLNESETNGLHLFTSEKADCFHCHGSPTVPLWTTNRFLNNAEDTVFNDRYDRRSVTKDPNDAGKYRVPTLRNIALTAPYMHDGRFRSLKEVLKFYNEGLKPSPYTSSLMIYANRGGMHLADKELEDLESFLNTLTDSSFIKNPAFSNPRPKDKYFIHGG